MKLKFFLNLTDCSTLSILLLAWWKLTSSKFPSSAAKVSVFPPRLVQVKLFGLLFAIHHFILARCLLSDWLVYILMVKPTPVVDSWTGYHEKLENGVFFLTE